jgi:hypothetical protein
MLLIGSRAIRFHLPSFREPKDWDLIASEEELARVAARLPANRVISKTGDAKARAVRPSNRPEDATSAEQKSALMERLAEEAQVVAVEQMLWDLANGNNDIPDANRFLDGATKWLRWTLRDLAIGPLPIETRYFLVNHYREVRDLVPPRWTDKVLNIHPRLTAK